MANPSLIPAIAEDISRQFETEGYSVKSENLISGGADISITKGGIFKAVTGMRTALKITLKANGSYISAYAGVGIFGQQVVPTIISMLVFWPVLLTQTWGVIRQSQLDDHAMDLIERAILRLAPPDPAPHTDGAFCPECGKAASGNFCAFCGKKLN